MEREYELVVYGATGFTGKEVCRYLQRNCSGLRWAISGRSESKLKTLVSVLGLDDSVGVLVCDASDHKSLAREFRRSSLILNCTGPYRFLGEPIVRACIDTKTHYMDISGEPQFMEDMFLKYHEVAEKAHVLVIHACAFDSVPADLGVVFCMQKFNEKYGETHNLSSIESFLSLNAGPSGMAGHYTTYECAVHGLGDVQSLRRIRREATAKYDPPNLISPPGCPILEKHNGIVFDESRQSYIMPFMGADAAVVRSSFRGRAMLTGVTVCPQYAAYVVVGTWSNMLATSLCGGAVAALAPYEWGRNVLLQYPEFFTFGIFSRAGPTPRQLEEASFAMHFDVTGFAKSDDVPMESSELDRRRVMMKACVSGPEPGYVATPIMFVVLAKTLLTEYKEQGIMPRGGVFTPAAAFRNSRTIIESLQQAEIVFTIDNT